MWNMNVHKIQFWEWPEHPIASAFTVCTLSRKWIGNSSTHPMRTEPSKNIVMWNSSVLCNWIGSFPFRFLPNLLTYSRLRYSMVHDESEWDIDVMFVSDICVHNRRIDRSSNMSMSICVEYCSINLDNVNRTYYWQSGNGSARVIFPRLFGDSHIFSNSFLFLFASIGILRLCDSWQRMFVRWVNCLRSVWPDAWCLFPRYNPIWISEKILQF